ncbi:Hypothetical predicted protein, partial [Mytilus galloprovincialis]
MQSCPRLVVEKMVCVVGKGHYMFDSEEYNTVKTLSINTISPDTYIAIIGRRLKTVLITDGQVLCQNVVAPPNTKVVFGEHVCKPSAESTSDEALPEYENTSPANMVREAPVRSVNVIVDGYYIEHNHIVLVCNIPGTDEYKDYNIQEDLMSSIVGDGEE